MADSDSVTAAQTSGAEPSTNATTKQAPTATDQASVREQLTEISEWLKTHRLSLPAGDSSLPDKYRKPMPTKYPALSVSEDWTECAELKTELKGRIFLKMEEKYSDGVLVTRYFQHVRSTVRLRAEYVDDKLIEHEWRFPEGGSILLRQTKASTDGSMIQVDTSGHKLIGWPIDDDIQAAVHDTLRCLKETNERR